MKIGIITHYYNSSNYGGILQSYALCKYLNSSGFDAKQICFDSSKRKLGVKKRIKYCLATCYIFTKTLFHPVALYKIHKRKKAFISFSEKIPHTEMVYTEKNIDKVNGLFDVFVTGSDQVWHPSVINRAYSLSFSVKPRYSYAASVAADSLSDTVQKYYNDFLQSYAAVSVRERNAMSLFTKGARLVLDPVFLLSENNWNEIASDRIIKEPYIFCYFLGKSQDARNAACEFARIRKLKLVTIPYLSNEYRKIDDYGDLAVFKASPGDFLSLLKNAEYIFTDSFHAICFSYIFKKQVFVFNRQSKASMGARISDILYTLDLQDRYYEAADGVLSYSESIDYSKPNMIFEELKRDSFDFIESIKKDCPNG